MIVMPSGISAPPPRPWRVRKMISAVIDDDNPERTEPIRKIVSPVR
jgi:hypothetical protein